MNLYIVILPAKVLSDGTHKIRIAISHNNETRYKITRFRVPSVKNVKNGKVVGKDIDSEYINRQLNGIIQSMYRAYDEIQDADCYTCSQLLQLIESKMSYVRPITFDAISSEWFANKTKRCKKSSQMSYHRAIDSFIECFGKSFILSTLKPSDINTFDEYLSESCAMKRNRKEYERRLSASSVNFRICVIRWIVRYAETRKYVDYDLDPFMDFRQHHTKIRDIFLPIDVMRKIRDIELDGQLAIARDIFMLSFYLCGMNLGDILTNDLSHDDVSFSRIKTDGRRKGDARTIFSIQPEARVIIERYIQPDGKVMFANRTTKNTVSSLLGNSLPRIAKMIGYDGRLMFYCARKSFAQYANELGIRGKIISYCLGNSTEGDVIDYYTKTSKQMADEAIRKVIDYL